MLGLPGNPVSALVTYFLFGKPFLSALAGGQMESARLMGRLTRTIRKKPGRVEFVPCELSWSSGDPRLTPSEQRGSHMAGSLAGAGALAIIPAEMSVAAEGGAVEAFLMDWGPSR